MTLLPLNLAVIRASPPLAAPFELPEPNIKYILNGWWLFRTLWLRSQSNAAELWRDLRWVHLCIVMLDSASCPHSHWNLNDVWKQHWKLDHQNRFLIATAVISVSPQSLKPQVKPQDPTKNPHRYSFRFLLILFTFTAFLFSDLSIQNRHFLSSLSEHFASIDIRVVSMFRVVSSSVL